MIHGIDFGRWTQWARPDEPPLPIDFVICGVSSGIWDTQTFEANKEHIAVEEIPMTYHFFNHDPSWKLQAEKFLKNSEECNSKALWWDWERSTYSKLGEKSATMTYNALEWLKDRFDGQVGIYSNFNDYVVFLQPYIPAKDYPLWLAWPVENIDTPGGNDWWWKKTDREPYDQIITQYSWKGYAPHYGALNDKKSMDLNRADVDLKVWLGLEDAPEPPKQPENAPSYEDGYIDGLERAEQAIKAIER